jgi:hypothetical protein
MNRSQWAEAALLSSFIRTLFLFVAVAVLSSLLLLTYGVDAQPESINVNNTIVTAPLTVIVPITADVQNAQICVSAASSGDQSCTQVIINPEQNSYEAINVDLSDPASIPDITAAAPGVSKTITPGSQIPDDVASTNSPQPPVINIQNMVVTQPLTVIIPIETDAQNAQICVTILSSGSQSCQQVVLNPETGSYTPVNVDLSQPTPVITPQETTQTASLPASNQPESINVEHTVSTAPITVIVPITGDIQNAQICVSAGSSGTQSCTQLIVNPEQTAYTTVSADLTQSETPTVSSTVTQEPVIATEPTATPTTITDSQQAPQSPASTTSEATTEPSVTDEPSSSSQSQSLEEAGGEEQPAETSEQGEDNNSNSDDTAVLEEEQESTSEEGSTDE